ncbi:hypothetical protein MKC70_10835 [[Clostridium] innocuum]|nr:hypothetical protein [[Clostridium] innocuum]MDU1121765.1 hypothetical protein [Erysipelotrichaceae bacterium]
MNYANTKQLPSAAGIFRYLFGHIRKRPCVHLVLHGLSEATKQSGNQKEGAGNRKE